MRSYGYWHCFWTLKLGFFSVSVLNWKYKASGTPNPKHILFYWSGISHYSKCWTQFLAEERKRESICWQKRNEYLDFQSFFQEQGIILYPKTFDSRDPLVEKLQDPSSQFPVRILNGTLLYFFSLELNIKFCLEVGRWLLSFDFWRKS